MSRYYCISCSSYYQFYKTRSDYLMICDHCGDELIESPKLKVTQIIGLIGASAIIFPLILMIVFLVKDLHNQRIKNSSQQITFLTLNLDDRKY